MIVLFKEVKKKLGNMDIGQREFVEMKKYSTISKEVERLRCEYGKENELINGRNSDDVCLVYDDVSCYIVKS